MLGKILVTGFLLAICTAANAEIQIHKTNDNVIWTERSSKSHWTNDEGSAGIRTFSIYGKRISFPDGETCERVRAMFENLFLTDMRHYKFIFLGQSTCEFKKNTEQAQSFTYNYAIEPESAAETTNMELFIARHQDMRLYGEPLTFDKSFGILLHATMEHWRIGSSNADHAIIGQEHCERMLINQHEYFRWLNDAAQSVTNMDMDHLAKWVGDEFNSYDAAGMFKFWLPRTEFLRLRPDATVILENHESVGLPSPYVTERFCSNGPNGYCM